MLNKLFSKKKQVSYFVGYRLTVEEDEELHATLSKTRIDKFTAEQLESAMKFEYTDGIISKIYSIEEGTYSDEEIRCNGEPLKFRDYPVNSYYALVIDPRGMHKIGGMAPADFIYPENNTTTPYVYLGALSKSDPLLNWLPFENLNLICPIYSDMSVIYLDYSHSSQPKLLNKKGDKLIGTAYDGLTPNNSIEFTSHKASFTRYKCEFNYNGEKLGVIVVPEFMQGSYVPTCPISGNKMKFLIQLESNSVVKLNYSDIKLEDTSLLRYFEHVDFWGSGVLYVFVEPTTKVVAYFIQNT